MAGLRSPFKPPIFDFKHKLLHPIPPLEIPNFPFSLKQSQPKRFQIYSQKGNGDKTKELPEEEKPKRLNLRLLDPDPDNIVAVGLTGLLTWASVQVLWQLFLISAAIIVAALKYSIVAALLITLL